MVETPPDRGVGGRRGQRAKEGGAWRSLVEPRFVLPACQINGRRLPHSAHGEPAAPKRGIPQATVPALPPSLPPSGPIRSLSLSVQSSWSGSRPAFAGLWKSLRGRRDVPRALRRSLHPLQTARRTAWLTRVGLGSGKLSPWTVLKRVPRQKRSPAVPSTCHSGALSS